MSNQQRNRKPSKTQQARTEKKRETRYKRMRKKISPEITMTAEEKYRQRIKRMEDVLDLLPAGITLNDVKIGFIKKVVRENNGSYIFAAREMDITYCSVASWMDKKFQLKVK